MKDWRKIRLVALALLVVCVVSSIVVVTTFLLGRSTSQSVPQGEVSPFDSMRTIPSMRINYPSNWPPHSTFPEEYLLVGESSGEFADGIGSGWVTQLRYPGSVDSAADGIYKHFEQTDWIVEYTSPIEPAGVFAYLRKPGYGSAIVIVEPAADPETGSVISVTVHRVEE